MFVLQLKEHYIVKTELTKNRTCQSYRWKDKAMCEDKEPLLYYAENLYRDPRIEWRIEQR